MTKIKNIIILLVSLLFCTSMTCANNGKLYTSSYMSSSLVTCITQDEKGFLWVGTANGLNRFDGYRFNSYTHDSDNNRSIVNNTITFLFSSSKGEIWIGTAMGLSRYDATTDDFERIQLSTDTSVKPRITSIAEMPDGRLFVGTQGFGLYEINNKTHKAVKTSAYAFGGNNDYYSYIFIDSQRRFWNADNDGAVTCFNTQGNKPRAILHQNLGSGSVMRIVEDKYGGVVIVGQNGLWRYDGHTLKRLATDSGNTVYNCAFVSAGKSVMLGTNGNGVVSLTTQGTTTKTKLSNDEIDLSTVNVTALFEDRSHNLWIGCAERGLAFVQSGTPQFEYLPISQFDVKTSGVITSMCHDQNGRVYVVVSGGKLYAWDSQSNSLTSMKAPANLNYIYCDSHKRIWLGVGSKLYSYNPQTQQATLKASFDCIDLRALCDDHEGNLYISTFGKGLCVFNPQTGEQRKYSMFDKDDATRGHLCNDWLLHLMCASDGNVWIATASGLQCFDPKRQSFKAKGWHNMMEGTAAENLAEDADGNIVIGTASGLLLYNQKNKKIDRFPDSEKIKDLKVDYIVCERNGDLWCSTSMGIWHYDKRQRQFTSYVNGMGLNSHEYLAGVGMRDNNGRIAFGTPDGVVAFNPKTISNSARKIEPPALTCILLDGKAINGMSESNGHKIVDGAVIDANHITLSHIDNSFTLLFSSFDFANIDDMQLEYRIGHDKWTVNGEGNNAISFTHLQSGKYKLEVRTNSHGQHSESQFYTITILAPWYASTMAFVVYTLLLIVVAYVVMRFYKQQRRRELDEEKMQFLINATHDIRTPLTLILNPLHQLMKQSETANPQDMDKLQTINHNANRILTLVNQILDIRKMDKLQMHLHCRESSMVQTINDACKAFEYNAKKRGITFRFEHKKDVNVYVDRTQFGKVLTNLLSNAFKYTNDGGEISIRLTNDEKNALIEVMDNGVGLKKDDLDHIFKRFYQSDNHTVVGGEGTGIGLNLCKMIVEMHHGTISARNRDDVRGSIFSVSIPLGKEHLKAEDIVENDDKDTPVKHPGTSYRVLLVDDDSEITDYISDQLSQHYHFTVCHNGKQAIGELLSEKRYDIVVSDIMMPEMDGFTLLRLIKTNSNISHIPVILLTTEAAIGNRLQGLERGADAFLAKPFMLDELRATIDNLIMSRLKLKGKFGGAQQQADKVEQQDVPDNDKELMDRIMKSINKNIGDSDFNVEMLCRDICVSRTQLHRKMKELTGLSTSEFIRNIRLEQAARLLKERHVNVSQVAYALGFTNTAHFSKVFKQHFGVPPSEYGRREEDSEEE